MDFATPAADAVIEKTVAALAANNITVRVAADRAEALKCALEIIPVGAEVMNNTSVTLKEIGLTKEILESGKYDAVRKRYAVMDPKTQGKEMRKLGCVPDWSIGSVHAITEDGQVMIASATGSQLPSYAFGAAQVLWVAGTQKIVKNLDEGMRRIYEHSLPLEDARARQAYGEGSGVNKILIINRESKPGRLHLILVKEAIGF